MPDIYERFYLPIAARLNSFHLKALAQLVPYYQHGWTDLRPCHGNRMRFLVNLGLAEWKHDDGIWSSTRLTDKGYQFIIASAFYRDNHKQPVNALFELPD